MLLLPWYGVQNSISTLETLFVDVGGKVLMNVTSVLTLIPSDIIGVLILLSLDFPPSSLSDNFFMYFSMSSLLISSSCFTLLASLLCFYWSIIVIYCLS